MEAGNNLMDLKKDKVFGKVVEVIEDISLILFILNSIQASILPIFIKISMPPNLYYTIRIFTALIFGDVPMWNEEI